MNSQRGVLTGLSVLVVEDNDDARDIFRLLLGYFGALSIPAKSLLRRRSFPEHV